MAIWQEAVRIMPEKISDVGDKYAMIISVDWLKAMSISILHVLHLTFVLIVNDIKTVHILSVCGVDLLRIQTAQRVE